jgi:hypothetical protein
MDLRLGGRTIESLLIEYTVVVRLTGGYVLVIESPLVLTTGDSTLEVDPADDPGDVENSLRRLTGMTVASSAAEPSGALAIVFDEGSRLTVAVDPHYEAWNVAGPDGSLVVCMPRGKLAIWDADPARRSDA